MGQTLSRVKNKSSCSTGSLEDAFVHEPAPTIPSNGSPFFPQQVDTNDVGIPVEGDPPPSGLHDATPSGDTSSAQPLSLASVQSTAVSVSELTKHLAEFSCHANHSNLLSHDVSPEQYQETLLELVDLLADGCGGIVVVVINKRFKNYIHFSSLDDGLLHKVFKLKAKNLHKAPHAFKCTLEAFSSHSDTDRWDSTALRALANNFDRPLEKMPGLLRLEGQPKDGAIILSQAGTVLAAGAHLQHTPQAWTLQKPDGTRTGTRHAAGLGVAEWMGYQEAGGVVFARSDAGGIHVFLPTLPGLRPVIFHIASIGHVVNSNSRRLLGPSPSKDTADILRPISAWYRMKGVIGSGSYGVVAQAFNVDNTTLAVKKIGYNFDNLVDVKRIWREILIHSRLRHPNIIGLLEIIILDDVRLDWFNQVYLIMELAASDLKKLCSSQAVLEPLEVLTMLHGLLCGCQYLHSLGIYHRDLKPANCLVNDDRCVKICDFTLARFVEDNVTCSNDNPGDDMDLETSPLTSPSMSMADPCDDSIDSVPSGPKVVRTKTMGGELDVSGDLTRRVASRLYRAPELLLEVDYTEKVDVWSIWCILGELLQMLWARDENCTPLFRGRAKTVYTHPGKLSFGMSTCSQSRPVGIDDSSHAQIVEIVRLLGHPEEDSNWLCEDNRMYINSLEGPRVSKLKERFSSSAGVPSQVTLDTTIGLLEGMLHFNPAKRPTVIEALDHPALDKARDVAQPPVLDIHLGQSVVRAAREFEETELSQLGLRNYIRRNTRSWAIGESNQQQWRRWSTLGRVAQSG